MLAPVTILCDGVLRGDAMQHRWADRASRLIAANPDARHCYVSSGSLERLLATPGVPEDLLSELTGAHPGSASEQELLRRLEATAIRLSLSPGRFHGLSFEEIVVLCCYTSERFQRTSWKREVSRQPSSESLVEACRSWLWQRVAVISSGVAWGRPRWLLAGSAPVVREASSPWVLGVAPLFDARTVDRDLAVLSREAGFAHEHYVACTPATAIDYLRTAAVEDGITRWDPFVLDRQLQALGFGLLLVERRQVLVYLPAASHRPAAR